MRDIYRTLRDAADASEYVLTEKKSKFIAAGGCAFSESEAADIINTARIKHNAASHHVYAYRFEPFEKYSDDGEPSGTGGLPVLSLLQKSGLQYCCIVVTRYFGGTLLGAGGLARAYGAAAKGFADLNAVTRAKRLIVDVTSDYQSANILQKVIERESLACEGVEYGEKVSFKLLCPLEKYGELGVKIQNAANGKAEILLLGEKYVLEPG